MEQDEVERPTLLPTMLFAYPPGSETETALKGMLEDLSHGGVAICTTAKEFQSALLDADFDLLVADLDLELGDPIELVRALQCREHEPTVLLVSSFRNPEDASLLQRSGCDRYILKSGDWPTEVGPAVRSLLRFRRVVGENRRLQAKLIEANMFLEAKNKRLDEFSATIAHDIRGPLGGICMKLDYVLEHAASKLDDRCKNLMVKAMSSANRLTDIVQAMYEYAKLGAKRAKLGSVDVQKLVYEVIQDLSFDESRDIKIGVDCAVRAWASADLLRRVFINLINNAVKYGDKHETIINIGTAGTIKKAIGEFVVLYVEDNGPGIPKDRQQELFTMFRRGDEHARTHEGIGVGLSVVERIIELHYGKVWVESAPGEGAKFLFEVPLEELDFGR